MDKNKLEYDCECSSCGGTGLYVGMAERDGIAIVCSRCKGTGKQHIVVEWTTFTGRKERENVKRVLRCNVGIMAGENTEQGLHLEDFGGMPYGDWAAGKPFPPKSEMRQFVCPAWWYQTANYDLKPEWDECLGIGTFAHCKLFDKKALCWKRWDKEQEGGE